MNNKYLLTKFKFILDDTSNLSPLVPIQEVNRTYFVSRYFIGRKDFRNFFSLFFATHGSNGHPSKFMFEVHFSNSDNILTMSLGSSFFFSGAFITHWLKRFTFHFYSYLKLPLNKPLDTKWIGRA
jgi:hypothetical protein